MRNRSIADETAQRGLISNPEGATPVGYQSGNGEKAEAGTSESGGSGNDFLKQKIGSLFFPDYEVFKHLLYDDYDEMLEYVRDTFANYYKLHGIEFDYQLTGDLGRDLFLMHHQFSARILDNLTTHCEYGVSSEGRIQVHLVNEDVSFDYEAYILPLEPILAMNDAERRLYEYFISYFCLNTGAELPIHNDYIDCLIGPLLERGDDDYEESYYVYARGGWVEQVSKRIFSNKVTSMDRVLSSFAYMGGDIGLPHQDLYECIKELSGVLAGFPDYDDMNYFDLRDYNDISGDDLFPTETNRTMGVMYSLKDNVVADYIGWLNDDTGNNGCCAGIQGVEITPETTTIFTPNKSLPLFQNAFKKLIETLERYERCDDSSDEERYS